MKQKLFTLLTALVLSIGIGWAQHMTHCSSGWVWDNGGNFNMDANLSRCEIALQANGTWNIRLCEKAGGYVLNVKNVNTGYTNRIFGSQTINNYQDDCDNPFGTQTWVWDYYATGYNLNYEERRC